MGYLLPWGQMSYWGAQVTNSWVRVLTNLIELLVVVLKKPSDESMTTSPWLGAKAKARVPRLSSMARAERRMSPRTPRMPLGEVLKLVMARPSSFGSWTNRKPHWLAMLSKLHFTTYIENMALVDFLPNMHRLNPL